MYINSPGGLVTSGMSMYDTMQYVKPDVSTVCMGQAASMGSLLLCAGAKDKRFSLPNSRIMLHQPSGGFQGQASDIEIHARAILSLSTRIKEIYCRHTGHDIQTLETQLYCTQFRSPEKSKDIEIGKAKGRENGCK